MKQVGQHGQFHKTVKWGPLVYVRTPRRHFETPSPRRLCWRCAVMTVLETVLEWVDGQRAAGGGSPVQAGTGPLTLLRGGLT